MHVSIYQQWQRFIACEFFHFLKTAKTTQHFTEHYIWSITVRTIDSCNEKLRVICIRSAKMCHAHGSSFVLEFLFRNIKDEFEDQKWIDFEEMTRRRVPVVSDLHHQSVVHKCFHRLFHHLWQHHRPAPWTDAALCENLCLYSATVCHLYRCPFHLCTNSENSPPFSGPHLFSIQLLHVQLELWHNFVIVYIEPFSMHAIFRTML